MSQYETRMTLPEWVMTHSNFARGLDDVRSGRPFDAEIHDGWEYERGRLFGAIAPRNMRLLTRAKNLNTKALKLYIAARHRGLIL